MVRETKYNESRLRDLISSGKNVKEIMEEMDITRTQFDSYHRKLMVSDGKFYQVDDPAGRSTTPKVTKTGLKISSDKIKSYGFKEGDKITIFNERPGKIIIEVKQD